MMNGRAGGRDVIVERLCGTEQSEVVQGDKGMGPWPKYNAAVVRRYRLVTGKRGRDRHDGAKLAADP